MSSLSAAIQPHQKTNESFLVPAIKPNQVSKQLKSDVDGPEIQKLPNSKVKTATSPSQLNSSSYEPNKDSTILFGSLPSNLFVQINNIIDASLVEGVSSLPFLPTSQQTVKFSLKNISQLLDDSIINKEQGKDQYVENEDETESAGDYKLLKSLRSAYAKNIDKAEIYALRNIFFIKDLPKSKRTALLHAMQNDVDVDKLDAELNPSNTPTLKTLEKSDEKENGEVAKGNQNDFTSPTIPASANEIPTETSIQKIEEEIETLRKQLLEKRRKRNISLSQLNEIKKTARTVQHVNSSVQSSIVSVTACGNKEDNNDSNQAAPKANIFSSKSLEEVVSSAMIGKKGLEQLYLQGSDLSNRLDEIKENKGDDQDSDLSEFLLKMQRKRNHLSLDDHFAAMKRRLPGTSNTEMEGVLSLLRKKKKLDTGS